MADFFKLIKNNETLTTHVVRASTFFEKAKGLLGRKEMAKDEVLWLSPCRSVHTFFMKFPIDVIFLNREGRIAALIPHLKPNRMTSIYIFAREALECAEGTIERWGLKKNEILEQRRIDV